MLDIEGETRKAAIATAHRCSSRQLYEATLFDRAFVIRESLIRVSFFDLDHKLTLPIVRKCIGKFSNERTSHDEYPNHACEFACGRSCGGRVSWLQHAAERHDRLPEGDGAEQYGSL